MPRPTLPEAVADVRRRHGPQALLRLTWAGEQSTVFHVLTDDGVVAFLKVGAGLAPERDRLGWLEGRLPVPGVSSFGSTEHADWLLMRPLEGLDLSNLKHTEPPDRIAGWLAEALGVVHAVGGEQCPFGEPSADAVVIHGDACLPNFLFAHGRLSGVVDVGSCGLGRATADLATAVWSLQFNLGPGHGARFLGAYGLDLDAAGVALVTGDDGQESLQEKA